MTIYEHATTFAGRPVVAYPDGARPADPTTVAWRLADPEYDGDGVFDRHLSALLAEEWAPGITALVIGAWGGGYDRPAPVGDLVAAAPRLTGLRGLFLADVTPEENEISWIKQDDVTPILEAYPRLEVLTIRGSDGLSLRPVRHRELRSLTFQSGGLPAEVVRTVGDCDLPALEHLELWLGVDMYGGNATMDDLRQILTGSHLPSLVSLGLRDAEFADEIAAALASAPVLARLEVLDLSLGMLSDAGASALLAGQPLTHLHRLDLHHHFLSQPVMDRLVAELVDAGVEVDLSEAGDPADDFRYVAVGE